DFSGLYESSAHIYFLLISFLYVSGTLLGRECQYTTQKRACQHDFWIFSAEFFETLKIACFLLNPLDF
uniref:hypothetical protein n=1 Tax=Faecalibacterium prausnitzii TaxID=853 RepID=UPI00403889ED